MLRLRTLIPVLTGSAALLCSSAHAQTTFTWTNISDSWSPGVNWAGGVAPTGTNSTDILRFAGDLALTGSWTASNDIAATPFVFNRLLLETINSGGGNLLNNLDGSALRFSGPAPQIVQNGTVGYAIENNLQFNTNLSIGGTGTGLVALRGTLSGAGNITKSGPSTLAFGNPAASMTTVSNNTWMGTLTLAGGDVLLETNRAAAGALRANPITFTGNSTIRFTRTDGVTDASLRFGNLNGNTGSIIASVQGATLENYNIVITALGQGEYGGSIGGPVPVNPVNDPGDFVVRGPGSQSFTGSIAPYKDVVIGTGTTVRLAGTASLAGQAAQNKGAITMTGGTFILDNTGGNAGAAGRLRDGATDSTGLETIGGGTFRLIGNATLPISETLGRMQLGSYAPGSEGNKRRSGQLNVEIVHLAGTAAPTELKFQSYSRDETEANFHQYATVDFGAKDGAGNALALGDSGNTPKVFLTGSSTPPPTQNGLLTITGGAGPRSVGWATVNGTDFASYNLATGVIPVPTTLWTSAVIPPATANARIEESVSTAAAGYTVNSIKIAPTSINQTLTISGAGHLSSTAFLLAGGLDFVIKTSGGGIAGATTRFFYVQKATLTVEASVAAAIQPLVKSGAGTLVLTNPANVNLSAPPGSGVHVSINEGTLRATPGTTLPNAELRLRGGQLEIPGGGTRSMTLGTGVGSINWTNISGSGGVVKEDMGSGGISAIGGDLTFNLVAATSPVVRWEDPGFVGSNYELVFGSATSDSKLIWTKNLSLSEANTTTPAYAGRTIRVLDNPASPNDWTRITASLSGLKQNDLIKAGPGMLELTGVNSYAGATIVQGGTLLVNSPGDSKTSFLHDVLTGATLGGNGTVGAVRVNTGGKLSPGSLPGRTETLNIVGDLAFVDATSQFLVDVGGSSVGSSIAGYDRLNVTGSVNLGGADLVGSFVNNFTGNSDVLFLILNDGFDPVQGQFSDGSTFMIGSQTYAISYTADSSTFQFSTTNGNDVAIQMIPEPSSVLLLGLGALLASRRRRTAQ